jgi:hypothetical protein
MKQYGTDSTEADRYLHNGIELQKRVHDRCSTSQEPW